jgi:enoyl-CoA hydratase/carnithine racemase
VSDERAPAALPAYETFLSEVSGHVLTLTLNRPERLNAFNQQMLDEFRDMWSKVRIMDELHVVVVRAAGDRAFSTGADVIDGIYHTSNVWHDEDPGTAIGPRANRCWKPLVVAVHGMCAAGAFYWLNEADIIICSDDAQFFDPHVNYGLTSALEPIGLARRIPLGEVLRWALMGLDERMSAARALQIGLVSEVLPRPQLWDRADQIAHLIAKKPSAAVQGTVRAIWESLDLGRTPALLAGMNYINIGNPIAKAEVDRATVEKPTWTLR